MCSNHMPMLYSHNVEGEKLNAFSLYLSSVLEGDTQYKQEVDAVLSETHELAIGKKNFYNINREFFPIIVFFHKSAPDFFSSDIFKDASEELYKNVQNIIQKPRIHSGI